MKEETVRELRGFVLREFLPGEPPESLENTTPLISGGVIDSIGTLKLVGFLEERFGIQAEAHEIDEENLDSIELMASFVESKQSGAGDNAG